MRSKFSRVKIVVPLKRPTFKKAVVVAAFAFGQLAFHRNITDNTYWSVTHLQSGRLVCQTTDKQDVKRYVLTYGKMAFWKKWEQCQDLIRLTLSGNLMSPNFKNKPFLDNWLRDYYQELPAAAPSRCA